MGLIKINIKSLDGDIHKECWFSSVPQQGQMVYLRDANYFVVQVIHYPCELYSTPQIEIQIEKVTDNKTAPCSICDDDTPLEELQENHDCCSACWNDVQSGHIPGYKR